MFGASATPAPTPLSSPSGWLLFPADCAISLYSCPVTLPPFLSLISLLYLDRPIQSFSRTVAAHQLPASYSITNPISSRVRPVGSIGRPCVGNGQKKWLSVSPNTFAEEVGFGTDGPLVEEAAGLSFVKSSSCALATKKLRPSVRALRA